MRNALVVPAVLLASCAVDLHGDPAIASIACFEAGIVNVSYVVSGEARSAFEGLSERLRGALGPWSEAVGAAADGIG